MNRIDIARQSHITSVVPAVISLLKLLCFYFSHDFILICVLPSPTKMLEYLVSSSPDISSINPPFG